MKKPQVERLLYLGSRLILALAIFNLVACASNPNRIDLAIDPSQSASEPFALPDSPLIAMERLPDEEIVSRTESSPFGLRASELLFRAMSLLGTPYRYGGTSPDRGFDCSGFVGFLYHDVLGFTLPRTSHAQAAMSAPEVGIEELEPGDLVFFKVRGRNISHVGIYAGSGQFVHAPSTGGRVRIDTLGDRYWAPKFVIAKRPLALVQEPVVTSNAGMAP